MKLDSNFVSFILTDKLIDNLVKEALDRDIGANLEKAPRNRQPIHLQNLIKAICSCGVSFSVWEKRDADGQASGVHEFTSLMGTDRKILLENLPAKLDGVIDPSTSATVIRISTVQYTVI